MRQWSDADELAGGEEALRLTGTREFAHLPVDSLPAANVSAAGSLRRWLQQTTTIRWMNRPPARPALIRSIFSNCSRPGLESMVSVVTVLHDL